MNDRNDKIGKVEDDALVKKAKELFDQSIKELDAETQSRLNQARHAALRHAGTQAPHRRWRQWAPAAGVAVAAVVAVVVWTGRPPVDGVTASATAGDFEMLLNEDSFEMLEELEFFGWIDLEGEPDDEAGANGNVG